MNAWREEPTHLASPHLQPYLTMCIIQIYMFWTSEQPQISATAAQKSFPDGALPGRLPAWQI